MVGQCLVKQGDQEAVEKIELLVQDQRIGTQPVAGLVSAGVTALTVVTRRSADTPNGGRPFCSRGKEAFTQQSQRKAKTFSYRKLGTIS